MRKIILCVATSLDGYIEGPNGEVDWMVFSEESGKVLSAFLTEIDTILYGRISYEAWGNYTPPENASAFEKDFYNTTAGMRKYVFSTTKTAFDGNPTVIQSNLHHAIHTLKEQDGKHIWLYGGADLISSFMKHNLIDEFRIAVMPILLGSGKPLFKEFEQRIKLKLLKVNSGKSGVVELNFEKL